MSRRFQAALLVASPCYPNAVVWSDENLLAVASGHLVTILNPAAPLGPRGLITLRPSQPFPIGVVDRKDLLSPFLLPICLSREVRPCVRSISWSPLGLAPNAGCLLAVCTSEGRVKLYRMPFCDYSAEWIEVVDITDRLHLYLASVNFEESENLCSGDGKAQCIEAQGDGSGDNNHHLPGLKRANKRKKLNQLTVVENENGISEENTVRNIVSLPDSGRRASRKKDSKSSYPPITAEQYALRNGLLSSLVVTWSPILGSAGVAESSLKFGCGCSVLAVGGKSGRVYFWRIFEPENYSVKDSQESFVIDDIGLLRAHDSWINALSFATIFPENLNPSVILATGSSNGSVKIWQADAKELLESTGSGREPFFLLKEVVKVDSSPISVVSLFVPETPTAKIFLAFGKGSGSFEVWILDLHSGNIEKAGSSNAHEHIVTGLAWAFGGKCLYSCSQDNSMHSWVLHDNSITEVPLPSNTPGVRSSAEVPSAYDLCFGLAVSPGNLVLAVIFLFPHGVRCGQLSNCPDKIALPRCECCWKMLHPFVSSGAHNFAAELLNPMYQERTHKAVIEFLWIGGQQLDLVLDSCPDFNHEAFSGFPEKELISWKNNIPKSLNQCQDVDKPLVVWDAVAALCAFNQSVPSFVQCILHNWLRYTFRFQFDALHEISSETCALLSSIPSRQLHIINILSRHVVLKEFNPDGIHYNEEDVLHGAEEQQTFWLKLVRDSEKELRERLISCNLSSVLKLASGSAIRLCTHGRWNPFGVVQMMQWASLNKHGLKDQTIRLAEEVRKHKNRLGSFGDYVVEEKCSLCSAPVPFESAEFALCQGVGSDVGVCRSHKLARCSVSMVVCPVSSSWFCRSCHRRASILAPRSHFKMLAYPPDFKNVPEATVQSKSTKPICPLCGILLQRLQPQFLLSPSSI